MTVAMQTTFLVHLLHLEWFKFECNKLRYTSRLEQSGVCHTDDFSGVFTSLRMFEIWMHSSQTYKGGRPTDDISSAPSSFRLSGISVQSAETNMEAWTKRRSPYRRLFWYIYFCIYGGLKKMAFALQTTFLVHFLHFDCLKFESNQLIHT